MSQESLRAAYELNDCLRKKSVASTPWKHYELSIAEVQLEGLVEKHPAHA